MYCYEENKYIMISYIIADNKKKITKIKNKMNMTKK